jgi:hypothetical protein
VTHRRSRSSPDTKRQAIACAALATLLLTGCGGGEADLSAARNFSRYPLYYLGNSFEGQPLTAAPEPYRNSFIYGDCEAKSDQGCAPPLEIQNASICQRYPLRYDVPARQYYGARGAVAGYFPSAGGTDLYTGGTTVTIFSSLRVPVRKIIAALRPVSGPSNLGRDLPPPAFPRTMLRELRRTNDPRALARRITALRRVHPSSC